ncbi:MotA/TolQ/ExbB proton channel family protein [Prevotella sp. RM4]|uniref:MotA/TolQ/ExbB proton channel family protein n=1 Tax=Prevotella sp. RM4 TaxID=1200547 RepID=UPI00051B16CA|nr:MotA/TolQ/ExbB proton channel family protein [Prevotella sp. RM4]
MTIITIVAVAVIVSVAICYSRPLLRLRNYAKTLKESKDFSDLSQRCTFLSDLCSDYDSTRTIDKDGEKKTLHQAEDFFNNSELARAKGINLKHINSAPGVLSGLGVLGTFVGLTFSVATFDSSDSAAIMTSIKTLLGGMGTAFITSLIGMALSAIYIIFSKKYYNNYDNAIAAFDRQMDQKFHISADEIIISENEKTKREILNRLSAIEKSKEVNEKLNAIQEALTILDEDGASITAGTMMLNLYEESEKQSQALESFTTDLSNELNASLGKTMESSIVPLIVNLEKSHEVMNTKIENLSNNIQSPATDFVTTAVGELKSSMLTMANEFRDSISKQSITQIEALANNLSKSGELLNTLPMTMQLMSEKVTASFNEVNQVVGKIQANVAKQQSDIIENTKIANDQLTNDFQQKFNEMASLQQSVLTKMSEQMDATMHSVMTQLEKAVGGLNEQQNSLSDTHARSTREIERLLQGFAQSVANMHNANSESSEMLVSIKKAGDNLNESTDKLKTLAVSLDSASTAITDQQKEATARFVEMQQENLNIISQLSTALSNAQSMVDSYVSDFETLKEGMKEVFKGINEGLKDYSATLRESTGGALAEYSDAMTKSTEGLKNIAAALEESAEELSDSIDKFKRLK